MINVTRGTTRTAVIWNRYSKKYETGKFTTPVIRYRRDASVHAAADSTTRVIAVE
jgi:hypothetical protein